MSQALARVISELWLDLNSSGKHARDIHWDDDTHFIAVWYEDPTSIDTEPMMTSLETLALVDKLLKIMKPACQTPGVTSIKPQMEGARGSLKFSVSKKASRS